MVGMQAPVERGATLLVASVLCTWPASVFALDLVGPSVTIDFAGFTGMGLDPAPGAGQLDSDDWAVLGVSDGDLLFGGSGIAGDYARGPSGGYVFTGGVYGFDISNDGPEDRALGLQPTGDDFTPGAFVLRVVNETGTVLGDVRIDYEVWIHNSGFRSSAIALSWSLDDVAYTDELSTEVVTPGAADFPAQWEDMPVTIDLLDLQVQPGDALYLRFATDDASANGLRDEIALDDVTVEVLTACGNGRVEGDETCDDGNLDDGDGCGSDCTPDGATSSGTGTSDTGTGTDEGTTGADETTATSALTSGPTSDTGPTTGLDTGSATGGETGTATNTTSGGDDTTAGGDTTSTSDGATSPSTTASSAETTETDGDSGGGGSAGILDDDGCGCRPHRDRSWPGVLLVLVVMAGRRRRARSSSRSVSPRTSTPRGPRRVSRARCGG